MKKSNRLILGLVLLFQAFIIFNHSAQINAAVSSASKGITISPFLQEATLVEADSLKELKVTLTNNTDTPQTLRLSVVDFGTLNDSGGVVFAGSNAGGLIKKYGLATWMRLSQESVSIEQGKSQDIKLTIENTSSMQPGGHYAAVVATAEGPNTLKDTQVGINQSLSSLVLVTKQGGEKYDLNLKNVVLPSSHWSLPKTINLNFYNPGNVHVVPRGTVEMVAPNGKVISRGVINEASSFVLPETSRKIQVGMNRINRPNWLPANYSIKVNYRYDGFDQVATKTLSLRYNNLTSILILILILIAALILVVWFTKNKISKKNKV